MADPAQLWGDLRSILARPSMKCFKEGLAFTGHYQDSHFLGNAILAVLEAATPATQKEMISYILGIDRLPMSLKGHLLRKASILDLHVKREHLVWLSEEDKGRLTLTGEQILYPWKRERAGRTAYSVACFFGLPLYLQKDRLLPEFVGGVWEVLPDEIYAPNKDVLFKKILTGFMESPLHQKTSHLERFNAWLRDGRPAAEYGLPPEEACEGLKGWSSVLTPSRDQRFILGETMCELEIHPERVIISLNATRFPLGAPNLRTSTPSAQNWQQFKNLLRDLRLQADRTPDKLLLDGSSYTWWSSRLKG